MEVSSGRKTHVQAKLYDEFVVGIYCLSASSSQDQEVVGHLPIELLFLLCKFLSHEGCSLEFSPTGGGLSRTDLLFRDAILLFQTNRRWYQFSIKN